jgi:hypothetical protein
LDNAPLQEYYPALYNIVRHKGDTIAKVMATSPLDVTFRHDLLGPRLAAWNSLLQRLDFVQLSLGSEEFRWNLNANGAFSIDSLYKSILQSDILVDINKKIWKMKIPLNTKFFGWHLHPGVILAKDNLVKRNWHGSTRCIFCHHDETMKHLFFSAALPDLYGQSSKQHPICILQLVLPIFLEIGFMV